MTNAKPLTKSEVQKRFLTPLCELDDELKEFMNELNKLERRLLILEGCFNRIQKKSDSIRNEVSKYLVYEAVGD